MGNQQRAPKSTQKEKSAIPKRDFSLVASLFSGLLGLLISLLLMHSTDLEWIHALPLASIPLMLAGKYSMENVARDMMEVAESLQEASKGNVGAFREARDHIMGAIEETEASLLPPEAPQAPQEPIQRVETPQIAEKELIGSISIAAKSVCFGATLEEASRIAGIPYAVLKDMHETKHPLWVRLCEESQSRLTDAMLHRGVTDVFPDE